MRAVSPRYLVVGSLLAIGAIFVVLAVVFSGGGDSNLPAGWKSFSDGPYKGAVMRDWSVKYVDFADYDPKELPDGIPEVFAGRLAQMQAAGAVKSILLVFFEKDTVFATHLNVVSCEPAASIDLIDTTEDVIDLYRRNLVNAEAVGKVIYDGTEFDLLQLFQVPNYDSYQVYLKTDDCYTAVNLATRTGDTGQVALLQEFTSHLSIDAAKLK